MSGLIEDFRQGVGIKSLSGKKLATIPINLPPLEEQQRIVEKVDELIQLCDQLEQQQTLNSDAHATLVDTLLKALTESSDTDEFQANWQRIVANFDVLFTTEYSIEQLKQTVLQLAVMGKLVKQDPSDEPASELLKKIAEEKAKLIKEGKIKKLKPLPEISEDEQPFELPRDACWVRLEELIPSFQNGNSSRGDKDGVEIAVLRLADITNNRISIN
jgi:type I restriction enzyme S subunit